MSDTMTMNLPLIIAVTTRAMFDLAEEHSVFERSGVEAYAALQRKRENDPLKPGEPPKCREQLLPASALAQTLSPMSPPMTASLVAGRSKPHNP